MIVKKTLRFICYIICLLIFTGCPNKKIVDDGNKSLKSDVQWNITPKTLSPDQIKSDRLPETEATDLIKNYEDNITDHKREINTLDRNNTTRKIFEFSFDSSELKEILDETRNGMGIKPDKIVFMFGHINVSGAPKRLIVVYGMYQGTPLLGSMAGRQRSIFANEPFQNIVSLRLTTGQVNTFLSNYTNDANNRLSTVDVCAHPNVPVRGFSFDAWQIEEILLNNAQAQVPDTLTLKIGFKILDAGIQWHVIAYGKKGELLNRTLTQVGPANALQRKESIFDKADPCPPCY